MKKNTLKSNPVVPKGPKQIFQIDEFAKKNKYNDLLGLAAIILLGALIYSNSFDCSFHLDDSNSIVENTRIRDIYNVNAWWNFNPSRPIAYGSFALNYHFNQLNVWGWHFVNLFIHLVNAMLVWWLTSLILSSPVLKDHPIRRHKQVFAILTALLFVSHPLATGSVTYIVQRLASLVAMFYLLSIGLYVKARLIDKRILLKYLLYTGSIASAALALLTKENAFTLPFAILLVEMCFLNTKNISIDFKNKRVILLLAAVVGVLLFALSKYSVGTFFKSIPPDIYNNFKAITPINYLFTQFSVIVKYIGLLLLPINQNLDYDIQLSNNFFEIRTLLNFGLLSALFISGVFLFKKYRIISFGIFWFFLTLAIESSIIPISDLIFEHRTYLPSIGFFLILNLGVFLLFGEKNKNIAITILLVIIASNSILTFQRNKVWKDDFTLWSDVIAKSPNKARGYICRSFFLNKEEKYDQVFNDLNRAIKLQPSFAEPINNRGMIFNRRENYELAFKDFNRAIELSPKYAEAYNNRGMINTKMGLYELALKDFNKALELKPELAEALSNRGDNYNKQKKYDLALKDLNIAIALQPNSASAYFNRGVTYGELGQITKSIEDYSKALEIDPKYKTAYINRGNIIMNENKTSEALKDFTMAIEIDSNFAIAYNCRGNLFNQEKRYQEAIIDYSKAITLKSDYAKAYYNRAIAENILGQKSAVCLDMKKAADLGYQPAKDAFNKICK